MRLPPRIASVALACGIDPGQSWGRLLLSIFLLLPAELEGVPLKARCAALFPHIDFNRLRPGDLVRIPLQILWLLLVRSPSGARDKSASPAKSRLRLNLRRPSGRSPLAPRLKSVRKLLEERLHHLAERPFWDRKAIRYGAYALSLSLAILCVTTPFNTLAQALFVALLWSIAIWIRRIPGPVATLLLVALSVTASTRYLWWRVNYTLNFDQTLDLVWGMLLLGAEIYTWFILLLGYAQTAWPLKRQPAALPEGPQEWPTVDIFIPTYNEPLEVVRPTVLAATAIDWPREKLRLHLLDDGRREEIRRLAEEAGIDYITRSDNRFAKAGNLNNALARTSGEFVAIFDCDHIPARSFLQMTMGWFLRDPKLALVQTPHHFFSPDPFERNLGLFRRVPNEGELFYGLIQDGNDLWNATFFCGSCAVLRRAPLEEIGGIAVETVTEDAHTALKLHRRGYTSAYLNIPQAAGLATESLSAHIGQRIRWARGMAQIFRIDNPIFGKGLSWPQRICYANAMLHFLYGIPRLIFLTAPLAFLLFHAYVIYAPAIAVALYVLPHMVHANITNSRIQGGFRRSFWAEVYETVLAWYIALPTTAALIDPKKGKFNVTAKGGLVEKEFFDWTISLPYLTLIAINLVGVGFGVARLASGPADEVMTVILNLLWTTYNIIILGGAVAVASEARQVRLSHRVELRLPAILHLPDGRAIPSHTQDFSLGGVALVPDLLPPLKRDERVVVSLWRGEEEFAFPARVTALTATHLRLRWELSTHQEETDLIQCTFARADAWITWSEGRSHDRPLEGMREVVNLGITGYRRLGKEALPHLSGLSPRLSALAAWMAWWLPRNPRPLREA